MDIVGVLLLSPVVVREVLDLDQQVYSSMEVTPSTDTLDWRRTHNWKVPVR